MGVRWQMRWPELLVDVDLYGEARDCPRRMVDVIFETDGWQETEGGWEFHLVYGRFRSDWRELRAGRQRGLREEQGSRVELAEIGREVGRDGVLRLRARLDGQRRAGGLREMAAATGGYVPVDQREWEGYGVWMRVGKRVEGFEEKLRAWQEGEGERSWKRRVKLVLRHHPDWTETQAEERLREIDEHEEAARQAADYFLEHGRKPHGWRGAVWKDGRRLDVRVPKEGEHKEPKRKRRQKGEWVPWRKSRKAEGGRT